MTRTSPLARLLAVFLCLTWFPAWGQLTGLPANLTAAQGAKLFKQLSPKQRAAALTALGGKAAPGAAGARWSVDCLPAGCCFACAMVDRLSCRVALVAGCHPRGGGAIRKPCAGIAPRSGSPVRARILTAMHARASGQVNKWLTAFGRNHKRLSLRAKPPVERERGAVEIPQASLNRDETRHSRSIHPLLVQ